MADHSELLFGTLHFDVGTVTVHHWVAEISIRVLEILILCEMGPQVIEVGIFLTCHLRPFTLTSDHSSPPSGYKGIGLMCNLQIPRAMLVIILNCPLETFTLVLELFQCIDEFWRYRFNMKLGAPKSRVGIKLICSLRPLTLMYQSRIGFWRYRFNMKLGSWGGYHPELPFESVVGFQKCLF